MIADINRVLNASWEYAESATLPKLLMLHKLARKRAEEENAAREDAIAAFRGQASSRVTVL